MNLHVLIHIFIGIFFSLIFYLRTKSKLNIFIVFNLVWIILVTVSSLGVYKLYVPDDSTYLILLLGFFCVNLGATISLFSHRKKFGKIELKYDFTNTKKFLFKLQIIIMIILIPFFIKGIEVINTKGMGLLRAEKVESFSQQLLIFWIAEPLLYVSIIISIFIYLKENKIDKIMILILVNCLLHVIAFGGRFIIFRILIYAFLCVTLVKRYRKKFNAKKVGIISLLCFIVYFVTVQRQGADYNVLKSIIVYFIGGICVFNQLNLQGLLFSFKFLYGRAFFGGLLDTGILGSIVLTGDSLLKTSDQAIYIINSTVSHNFQIGEEIYINAFTTMFYPFIRDGGIIGLIICSCLVGLVVGFFMNSAFNKTNLIYKYVYVVLGAIFLEGIFRWNMLMYQPWMILFYIVLFRRKLVGVNKNEKCFYINNSL